MAHAQEQGRAEQGSTGQHQWRMQSALCMQHSGVQDGNVALLCCLLTAQSAHKD
jgi:hypothetical protein